MRYYFWTISGAGLAAVLVIGEMWSRRSPAMPRALGAAAAVIAVPTAMAVIARLGFDSCRSADNRATAHGT